MLYRARMTAAFLIKHYGYDGQHQAVDRPRAVVTNALTLARQISAIGNSVCPPMARARVAANQPGPGDMRMAA